MSSTFQLHHHAIVMVPALLLAGVSSMYYYFGRREKGSMVQRRRKPNNPTSDSNLTAHEQLIIRGTPMVKLQVLSKIIRRHVYVKMESLNPGGTGKDRAALSMIRHAEASGLLPKQKIDKSRLRDLMLRTGANGSATNHTADDNGPSSKNDITDKRLEQMVLESIQTSRTGGLVVEGTSGSTGIALATLCAARGHACLVVLPDDQAEEKQKILRSLGAVVFEVPTAAISNPNHYVNLARKAALLAQEKFQISAVFTDQFENEANYEIHYHQTGPEIWYQLLEQTEGKQVVDAFVMSSGTGGTIAGVGNFLKEQNSSVKIVLVDPPGSSLYHKVEHGIAYAMQQSERSLRKHRYDTLAEGIGLDRITHNFSMGLDNIDRAIRVTDQEAVDMAHWALKNEGLWMGSSSAMNLVGAIRVASDLPPDSNVVTMICDAGQRHTTRFWNPAFVKERGLQWPTSDCIPECLKSVLGDR